MKYAIHYGISSKDNAQHPNESTYEFSKGIKNHDAINVTLEKLPDGEKYDFSAIAFDTHGKKSIFSNEISKTLGLERLQVITMKASDDDSDGPANRETVSPKFNCLDSSGKGSGYSFRCPFYLDNFHAV